MKRLLRKTAKEEFNIGDRVIFKTHPYDNTTPYVVEDKLENGTYFISNEDNSYTGINGVNLEKLD